MAKKKKLQSKAPVPMTRGQLSRAARERRRIRNLYIGGAIVGALVVLIIVFSLVYTFIIQPNVAVAKVGGVNITRDTYNKLRRYNIYSQLQSMIFQQQLGSTSVSQDSITTLQQQLTGVETESTLDSDTVGQLIDGEVLRQKSQQEFGLNPTRDDLKKEALKDFAPTPTPVETPTPPETATPVITGTVTATRTPAQSPTPTSTPTAGSPTTTPTPSATLPPVPGASATAEALYSRYMTAWATGTQPQANNPICQAGCPKISEDDYLHLLIDPKLRQTDVTEKLSAGKIVTDVEQIHVQHILTDTPATQGGPVTSDPVGIKKIEQELKNGADFTKLANEQSSEQIQNEKNGMQPNGGDLGWFDKDHSTYVKEFTDAAFAIKNVGDISPPVKTQFGWHIIKLLGREKRPLDQSTLDQDRQKLYTDWFNKAKDDMQKAGQIWSSIPQAANLQPTPAITEPTTVPAVTSPASGTPAASPPVTGTTTTSLTPTAAGTPGSSGSSGGNSPGAPSPASSPSVASPTTKP